MKFSTCTLVIPVYNEAKRLTINFPLFQRMKYITQIIVVDDGSTDGCTQLLDNRVPHLTILHLPHNVGKTDAIRIALKRVTTRYVLLMDADLQHLRPREIEKGLTKAFTNHSIDMILFIRTRLGNVACVYTGERLIKTLVLKKALSTFSHARGFQLEAVINQYCLDTHKSVRWLPISASNTFQIVKKQSLVGLLVVQKTIVDIIRLVGWKHYIQQILLQRPQLRIR